jgi:hypothetical protein
MSSAKEERKEEALFKDRFRLLVAHFLISLEIFSTLVRTYIEHVPSTSSIIWKSSLILGVKIKGLAVNLISKEHLNTSYAAIV